MKKILAKIDSFFKISERGSTITKELIGGLIVFLAMVYILPVNSGMLSKTGLSYGSVFLATAVSAGIATLIMGLVANYPIALASGMGLNALMTVTVCDQMGYSYQECLCLVFVSGLIFVLISVTGIRKRIISAIPKDLKYAIGAGIGGFISLVGLSNAGIIVSGSTILALGAPSAAFFLAIGGIALVFIFHSIKCLNKFAVILAILVTTVIGLILNACGVAGMPSMNTSMELGTDGVFAFAKGFGVFARPEAYAVLFTFLFVDFFDTAGTLVAVGTTAGLVDVETGELKGDGKAFLADAIGTVAGAALGTSTVTSFIESSTGVESGARTGLSAVVVAILFFLSLLLFPIFSVFANCSATTSMALVYVGALMFSNLGKIDWADKTAGIAACVTVFGMVFCYSISDGLALGFIVYVIMKLVSGKGKEVNVIMYVLSALFVINFAIKFLMSSGIIH